MLVNKILLEFDAFNLTRRNCNLIAHNRLVSIHTCTNAPDIHLIILQEALVILRL